jgi:hypothetical protein
MEEERKEEVKVQMTENASAKKSNFTEKMRENPWTVSTFILGILVVIFLVITFSGTLTGNVISKDKAADNLITYLNTVADSEITLVGIENSGDFYLVTVKYQEQEIPVYMTKDGNYYTTTLIPLLTNMTSNTDSGTAEIPKTEKPSVELYVFTYCPYGTQMEKAVIPVIKLLGDKIDFKIRQIGAMHGDFEKVEAERQLCIEKNYPAKFLDYVLAFAEDANCSTGADSCVTTKVNALFSKLGIDASKINTCMTSEGAALYDAEVKNAGENGVSGSPTLLINGVTASPSSRSPEAVKETICEAFSSVPTQCSQKLSTTSASAGFGTSGSSSSSASC